MLIRGEGQLLPVYEDLILNYGIYKNLVGSEKYSEILDFCLEFGERAIRKVSDITIEHKPLDERSLKSEPRTKEREIKKVATWAEIKKKIDSEYEKLTEGKNTSVAEFEKKRFYDAIMLELIVDAQVDYTDVFAEGKLKDIKDEIYNRVKSVNGSQYDFGALFLARILTIDNDFIRRIPVSALAVNYLESQRINKSFEIELLTSLSKLADPFSSM